MRRVRRSARLACCFSLLPRVYLTDTLFHNIFCDIDRESPHCLQRLTQPSIMN